MSVDLSYWESHSQELTEINPIIKEIQSLGI